MVMTRGGLEPESGRGLFGTERPTKLGLQYTDHTINDWHTS